LSAVSRGAHPLGDRRWAWLVTRFVLAPRRRSRECKRPSYILQKVKRASNCIVRAVAWVRRPKLPEPVVVTSPVKLV